MNKINADFAALRAALRREKERSKELFAALNDEREKVTALEAALECERGKCADANDSLEKERVDAENRLAESRTFADEQIAALAAERAKCEDYARQIEYLKGDGLWETVRNDEDIKKKMIGEYLKGIPSGVSFIGAGYAALTPVHKPQNLADAKRLAEKIINA